MKIDEALSVYFGTAQPVGNQGTLRNSFVFNVTQTKKKWFLTFRLKVSLNSPCNFCLESTQFSPSLPVRKCPNCGQDMIIRTKKDGKG